MEMFFRARLGRCDARTRSTQREQERKKKGSGYESSNSICLCGHRSFHDAYCSLIGIVYPVLYVRQDKTIDRVNSVNQSSPWTQAHHPTFAPRAPSVPHALQTQNPAAPQKRARSCSQDRTHPSLAPVSKADRSEPVTQQNTLLPCTSPVAVDDHGHSYAVPVLFVSGDLRWEVACGGRGWRGDAPDQNLF